MENEPAETKIKSDIVAAFRAQVFRDCVHDKLLFFKDEVGLREIKTVTVGTNDHGEITTFVFSEDEEGG